MSRIWLPGDSDFALAMREPNLFVPGAKPTENIALSSDGLRLFGNGGNFAFLGSTHRYFDVGRSAVAYKTPDAGTVSVTGESVVFPGSDVGQVIVPASRYISPWYGTNGIFVFAEFKTPSSLTGDKNIVSSDNNMSGTGYRIFQFRLSNANLQALLFYGASTYLYTLSTSITANTIYRAAVMFGGTVMRLYVNGNLAASHTVSSYIPTASGTTAVGGRLQLHNSITSGIELYSGEIYAYGIGNNNNAFLQDAEALTRGEYSRYLRPANDTPFMISVPAGGGTPTYSETYATSAASSLALSESYATGYAETYAASAAAALTLTDAWLLDFAETYGANASGDLALTDGWSLDYSEAYAVGAVADLALTDTWQLDYAETLTVTATGDLALSNAYAVGNNYDESFSVAAVAELSLTDVWAPHYGETLAADATAALALTDTWQLDYAETLAASAAAELLLSDAYDSPAPGAYDETFTASAIAALDLAHLFTTPNALPAGINHLAAMRVGGFFAVKP